MKLYKYEYKSLENGMIPSIGAHSRDLACWALLQVFASWGYKPSEIVHHGWGFWTRGGVFLGHIVPQVANVGESVYTDK